jgi:isoleucyl-tRNA synthetase
VYLADYATATDGTGIVHSSPAYGVDDFNSCVAHGMKYDDILNPVQGNGRYANRLPAVRRPEHLEGLPRHHRGAAPPAA